MLSVTLVGDRELVARLDAIPSTVHRILRAKVQELAIRLQAHIQRDKLSGQVLNVVTGALRRSVTFTITDSATAVFAKIFSSGDVKYACIHEFGGKTRPHDIYPRSAEALHFMAGGQEIFAKVVHHPGSRMPERSFMRSGLGDYAATIVRELQTGVAEGIAAEVRK